MAPTFTFKLGSLDLSAYCRMNPDDGLDPYGQPWLTPAFTETPYADGQPLLSETVGNREQQWELFLHEPSKDLLHQLIREINLVARSRPLQITWQDDAASSPTFFDVAFVRFEPNFNFRRSTHGYAAGSLHAWVNGYGHTGTTRITATAAGTGVFLSVPIGSIAGDAPALLDTTIIAGAVLPTLGRIVAVAPITNPSYSALIPAASLVEAQAGATLVGASGAQGSQCLALPVSPTGGASGIACRVPLQNPTIMGGDNRILAVVTSDISAGVGVIALDPYGNSMGGTAVASMGEAWGLIDLGVCRLPTVGFPTQPKITIQAGAIWASGAAAPALTGSPGFSINEIICLPDKNLTLLLENNGGASAYARDTFNRAGAALLGSNDDLGNAWSAAQNNANLIATNVIGDTATGMGLQVNKFLWGGHQSATTKVFDADREVAVSADTMVITAKPIIASPGLGGEEVRLFKDVRASQYVQARLAASKFLALESATAAGGQEGNLLASVQLATLSAGLKYRLLLQLQGVGAFVNLSRDDGGPVFAPGSMAQASIGVASDAGVSGQGAPAIAIACPSVAFVSAVTTKVYSWEVRSIASSNLSAFDSYRIDGPDTDSYRTASSGVFSGQKLVSNQRGAFPKAVPSTTSIAVVCAPFDQGVANDKISAVVSVRERFFYAR